MLKTFAEQTGQSMSVLHAQLQRLGSTWRDQDYGNFVQEMRRIDTQLATLREEVRVIAPVLEADAVAAEAIHRDRL